MPPAPCLAAPAAEAGLAGAAPAARPAERLLRRLTGLYGAFLRVLLAFTPSIAIVYLHVFQSPLLRLEHHFLHEVAIAAATVLSAFVCWVTWRCYESSGEPFLRWLTLGFLAFTLLYAPHGVLTRLSHDHMALFLNFGPVSRLLMMGCLLYGLLQYGRPAEDPARFRREGFWWRWIVALLGIDIVVGASALAGLPQGFRLSVEVGALVLALAAVGLIVLRRIRSPLMLIYAIALAFFAQSSVSFLLAQAWNHQWWLAHAVFAAGFFLLSYGVVQAFHTTRAFSEVYGEEEMIRRLEAANAELRRLAATDALTGASNRRHFMERIGAERERALRAGSALALLAVDLDHFKRINDDHGHAVGDEVLRRFVVEAAAVLRPSDLIGRTGGEEFAILLPGSDAAQAAQIASRLRERLAAARILIEDGAVVTVTASMGVACFGADGDSVRQVFRVADERLYAAKHAGRDRVVAVG